MDSTAVDRADGAESGSGDAAEVEVEADEAEAEAAEVEAAEGETEAAGGVECPQGADETDDAEGPRGADIDGAESPQDTDNADDPDHAERPQPADNTDAPNDAERPQPADIDVAGKRARDPERDRRLGVRVAGFLITLCVLVAGWAAVTTPTGTDSNPRFGVTGAGSDSGSGSPSASASASSTAAAQAKLVQQIAGSYTFPGTSPSLPWPVIGQAAVEVEGVGLLGTSGGTSTPVPIASVTKVMTAYLILKHHPLADGESGPTMTVTAAEAAAYDSEVNANQSVVRIYAGEQLSERDALEALLLASADNVAKILARWDAGSISAFVSEMNVAAAQFGMTHTTYTDPSGLDPSTVSTATDQIALGRVAMQSATFRQLVAERTATIPKDALIDNYNTLLGGNGVIGIKTGSTSQAGGCLLFAATVTVGGRTVTIIGAVLGQQLGTDSVFLARTLAVAKKLIIASEGVLTAATLAVPGHQLAVVRRAGTADVRFGVSSTLTVIGWPGLTYRLSASGDVSTVALAVSVAAAGADTASATSSVALVPIFAGDAAAAVD